MFSAFAEDDAALLRTVEAALLEAADVVDKNYTINHQRNMLFPAAAIYTVASRRRMADFDNHVTVHDNLYRLFFDMLTNVTLRYAIPDGIAQNRDAVFKAMIQRWKNFKVLQKWMLKTFAYLARFYIESMSQQPLDHVALTIFYNQVFKKCATPFRAAVLHAVHQERVGEEVNADDLRVAVELTMTMGFDESAAPSGTSLPRNAFIEPLLQETNDYYKRISLQVVMSDALPMDYAKKAHEWLMSESQRAARLFPSSTQLQQLLVTAAEHQILEVHEASLLNHTTGGLAALIQQQRDTDIRFLFDLFAALKHGIPPMALILKQCCQSEGTAIAKGLSSTSTDAPAKEGTQGEEPNCKQYCVRFMALQEKYTKLLSTAFNNNSFCANAVRDAMEASINIGIGTSTAPSAAPMMHTAPRITAAELLSSYVDMILKGGPSESATEEETDAALNNMVSLVSRLSDKDMFGEFLRRLLSRRLLLGGAFHEELERSFIAKLKQKFGASSTSRLEHMISDRNTSNDFAETFKQHLQSLSNGGYAFPYTIDFTAQVLTAGVWPPFVQDTAHVPPPIKTLMDSFFSLYERGKSRRVLQWISSMGSATINASFKGKEYQLQMTIYQAIVLLLFEPDPSGLGRCLSMSMVQDLSGIDFEEIKRVVQSFCHSKVKLLSRKGAQSNLQESDTLTVNEEFTSSLKKIKVPVAIQKAAAVQAVAVAAAVQEDRRPAIDACVVRIMKSRRQEEHTVLVTEVISQLTNRFVPDPKLIKSRIEELLARDYLERHPQTPNTYVYVA